MTYVGFYSLPPLWPWQFAVAGLNGIRPGSTADLTNPRARITNIVRRRNHLNRSKPKCSWKPTRVQIQASEAAREQADREAAFVPWKQLLKARRDYVRWQAYYLWVRAIEEAEGEFPFWLAEIVEKRARGYLHHAAHFSFHHKHARRPDTSWRMLQQWVHEYIFQTPWKEGWMDAVGYYAVRDLASLRDDAYSDWCVESWKSHKPTSYPSFKDWRRASERVTSDILDQVEMREDRRELIKQMRSVPPRALQVAVDKYVAWKVFACWASVALEEFPQLPEIVERELQMRCPGFLEEHGAARQNPRVFDSLMYCIEDHHFHRAKQQGWFDVLLYEVELHPRHARAKDYWIDWEYGWTQKGRPGYPSLESWTAALDKYTFKPED